MKARVILPEALELEMKALSLELLREVLCGWLEDTMDGGLRALTQKEPLDANPEYFETLKSTVVPRFQADQ